MDDLTEALRVKSANHVARRLLTVVLGQLGRYQEAYDNVSALLNAEPKHSPNWVQAAAILCELGRAAEVPELLSRAQLGGEMLTLASEMLLDDKHHDEVIQLVQKSPWLDDENFGEALRLNLGRAFFGRNQWDIAAEVLMMGPISTRTRHDPIVTDYRYWLGLSYLNSGDKAKAKTQLSKVYAEDIAYREIAVFMKQLG